MFKALAGPARQPAGLAYTTLGAMHKYSICHAVSSRSIWRHWTGGEGGVGRSARSRGGRRSGPRTLTTLRKYRKGVEWAEATAGRPGEAYIATLDFVPVPQLGWVPFKLASMRRVPASPVSYAHVLSEGPLR